MDGESAGYYFYDVNAKVNYDFGRNDKLYLSGYFGKDVFYFRYRDRSYSDRAGLDWGNATATLRWNHLFNERLFSNFTAYYSNYDYQINFGDEATNTFDWDANIVNYSLKGDLSYYINTNNQLTFGGQAILYEFSPGNAVGVSEGEETNFSLAKKYGLEGGVFVENDQKIHQKGSGEEREIASMLSLD